MQMKEGEVYYYVQEPLDKEYTVLKVEGNYAYLGQFQGDQCRMRNHYMPNAMDRAGHGWTTTRAQAIREYANARIIDAQLLLKMAEQYEKQEA